MNESFPGGSPAVLDSDSSLRDAINIRFHDRDS